MPNGFGQREFFVSGLGGVGIGGVRGGAREPPIDLLAWLRRQSPETQVASLRTWITEGKITPEQASRWAVLVGAQLPTIAEEPVRVRRVARKEPEVPLLGKAGDIYYPFIKGLPSPAMQEYFTRNIPQEISSWFGRDIEQPGLRRAMEALRGAKGRRGRAERAVGALTPIHPKSAPTAERLGAHREARGELAAAKGKVKRTAKRIATLRKRPHPFQAYLEKYPFVEEYMRKPPAERGYFPSTYRPPTRWLSF